MTECAPSAATRRRADSAVPSASSTSTRRDGARAARGAFSSAAAGGGDSENSVTATGRSATPSSFAFATSAASSGPFSIMCANGSSGSTSPSKVRKVGRTASCRRLSVTTMSRMGCASTACHTPMVSNRRRAAATMAEARGSLASRAALASEASGQRGNSIVRAHSASEDARERADDTRPEPGSSARAALASEASGQRGNSIVRAPDTRPEAGSSARAAGADLDTVWREEWAAMADRVAAVADQAAAEGREITAGNHYMRAGNYYYSAERFIPPGAEKLAMYRKALRAYQAAMERLHPQIERVEVPYEGTSLPAYFVKGAGSGRRPTVVLFDGMDNAKEMSVIFAGLDFARRGINTLAIDGPGQAETLRLRNIVSRHDYEVPGTAAYDYVAARPEVDPARVAVMGYSFGGYQAPRIAAFEKRYAAAVAFGAMHWSIYEWVAGNKARLAVDPRTSSTSIFQFRWVVGAPDNETALEWAKKFTLEGVAQRIECAFLVLHGENDRIVPLAEARKLYERVGSKRKHIKIFTAEEGGAEHCQVDHRQLGIDYIADWLLANM